MGKCVGRLVKKRKGVAVVVVMLNEGEQAGGCGWTNWC